MTESPIGNGPKDRRRPVFRVLILFGAMMLAAWAYLALNDAERLAGWLLRWADKRYARVIANPAKSSPSEVQAAVERYSKVDGAFPGTRAALEALNNIGAMAMARHEYELARRAYEPICERYAQSRDDCQMSQIFIGRSYEAQGQWDKAEQVYLDLERFYVWTPVWIEAPLYPAQMYERHGMDDKAQLAYQRAKETCLKRIKATRDPDVVTLLAWQLIKVYQGLGNWGGAQQQLRNIIDSGILRPEKKPEFILELASVLERHYRYSEAQQFLMKLIEEFPDSPKVPEARKILSAIGGF